MYCKKIFIFFVFQFSAFSLYAQNEVDTLLHMLRDHKNEDTTRLLIWATLAKEYTKVDLDRSLSASDTVIRLARILILPGWEANAYNAKGGVYYGRGEYVRALQSFEKALEKWLRK